MSRILILVSAFVFPAAISRGEQLTVPQAATLIDMDTANQWPFIYPPFAPLRYQQVYESKVFEPVGSPILITKVAFRPDAVFGMALSGTISQLSLSLSTTQRDELSLNGTDLDANVGNGSVEVFPRQGLPVSLSFPAATPKNFDLVIPFDVPYLYDPTAGNLLIEVNNFSGEALTGDVLTSHLDASEVVGDGLARAWSALPSAPAYGTDSVGLVTRFSYIPVPEPAFPVWLMFLVFAGRDSRRRTFSANA